MPQVFISYSRHDSAFADQHIVGLLKALHLDPWIDQEDLHGSDQWMERIKRGMQGSDWFILLMSEHAAASRHVRDEVEWIISNRPSRLIPVLISPCRPEDIHPSLPTIHHIAFNGNSSKFRTHLIRSLIHGMHGIHSTQQQKVVELSKELENVAEERDELQSQVRELAEQLDQVADFDGDWLDEKEIEAPPFIPQRERNAPIISVLNLKGGVGKSTLAVNIAAMFFQRKVDPKRVLIVDLDFQMSATTLCLDSRDRADAVKARAISARLLQDDDASPLRLFQCAKRIGNSRGTIVPADDGLATQENKTLARWLTNQSDRDVRFLLRERLHSQEVQREFDLIILDCPPRLHVGAINALAASDFVLIPVLLDLTSADSVPRLLSWLARFRSHRLCPDLEVLGVIANKKSSRRKELLIREENLWSKLGPNCQQQWRFGKIPLLKNIIPESSAVSEAAETPGRFACENPSIRPMFENLIKEIEPRLFSKKEAVKV